MPRAGAGELEAAVMDVVWEGSGWMTPGDVLAEVAKARDLAYNTVLTIMVRLWRKGRLVRERNGRAYAYQASQTREGWAATRMSGMLAEVHDRPAALSLLMDDLSARDRDQLRRLLADRSRGPKGT